MLNDTLARDESALAPVQTDSYEAFPTLDACAGEIEAEYTRLGHSLGWRFVTGPAATFSPATKIALVTLNPGGSRDYPEHPSASSEAGSSYWVESWDSHQRGTAPLQRQIQSLFAAMAEVLGVRRPVREWVETEVLTANFVPFRSSRFAHLHRAPESLAFSRRLWSRVLAHWTPSTLLTIDTQAFSAMRELLVKEHGFRSTEARSFDTGWGAYNADAVRLVHPVTQGKLTLGRLPHLSTFKLFSRPSCEAPVREFLRYLTATAK